MRYSQQMLLGVLLVAGLTCPPARAAATNGVVKPKTLTASEAFAAQQKAKQDAEAAKANADAEQFQRQQEEKARLEAERQRELRRIELEVLKAAEARGQKPA